MKAYFGTVAAFVALSLAAGSVQAAKLSTLEVLQIKSEIKQLVDNYGIYRDSWDAKGYANCFTEDGKLSLYGTVTVGRAALQKRVDDANHSGRSSHVMTTSRIEVIDSNHATGIQYATIYNATPEPMAKPEDMITVKGPNVIGKYLDRYERTKEGWKIAERTMVPLFTSPK